jgi:hypothetical protein
MSEENFLSLQSSEAVIANMASRLFAAYLQMGEVTVANEDEYIKKSIHVAMKMAHYTDTFCKSDGEWMTAKGGGATGL